MTTQLNEATVFKKVATSEDGMISAGIKELKNNLSRYLSQVKKGEDILVTERGKAIARIVKEDSKDLHLREVLSPLIVKGLVKLPSQKLDREISTPVKLPGKPVSDIVIEDRR